VEPSEAAHGRGFRRFAADRTPGIRRIGGVSQTVAGECMIELEGCRGKLRICLKGAPASYLATLSRELWESAS
jgi:hypothetical protein